MSHHLKILANAGLVATRREGTTIFYRRNESHPDTDLQSLQHALFQTIDDAALDPALRHTSGIDQSGAFSGISGVLQPKRSAV